MAQARGRWGGVWRRLAGTGVGQGVEAGGVEGEGLDLWAGSGRDANVHFPSGLSYSLMRTPRPGLVSFMISFSFSLISFPGGMFC